VANLTLSDLRGFNGSEQFFRHTLYRSLIYTQGIQYLAENAGAYWLIDEVATANKFSHPVKQEAFQVWKLTKDTRGCAAWLVCEDGNDNSVFMVRIPYTDFPLDTITLYCEYNGDGYTLMLPGER
jgi:hypothetical protein